MSRAYESGYAGGALDQIPSLIIKYHLDKYISRKYFSLNFVFLSIPGSIFGLSRHKDSKHPVLEVHRFRSALDVGFHLVLVPGICMYRVPLFFSHLV